MENVNVVFVGHVDHGKSTTIGRLLYDSENVEAERVDEIQKFAEALKQKFDFAYFLDAFEEERKNSMTIDTTRVIFKGKNRLYTIIDSPGHKEFLKNMLTGASQAEMAILIVSVEEGIREQTGRHMFLISLLGIKHIIVAVNKMDIVGYDEDKFNQTKNDVEKLLKTFGFDTRKTQFVPISAINGDNVYNRSENMKWFDGTLIGAIDRVIVGSERLLGKPLRFSVQDIYDVEGRKIVVGRVQSNILRKNDQLVFQPSSVRGRVKNIEVFGSNIDEAKAGDAVGINLDNSTGITRGDVCGRVDSPPRATTKFTGEMVLLTGRIHMGETIVIKCGTKKVECVIEEIAQKIDSENGRPLEESSADVKPNEAAIIRFHTVEPLVLEKFSEIHSLGRFVISKDGKNAGAGIVLEIGQ